MPILLTNASPSTGREWTQSISRLDCRPSGHDPGSYVVDKVAGQVTESAAGQAGQASQAAGQVAGQAAEMT